MFLKYFKRRSRNTQSDNHTVSKCLQSTQGLTQEHLHRKSKRQLSFTSLNEKSCKRIMNKSVKKQGSLYDKMCVHKTKHQLKKLPEVLLPMSLNEAISPLKVSSKTENKLSLLDAIRPQNCRSEKERFMRSNFNYNPYFVYSMHLKNGIMEKFRAASNRYILQAVLILERVTKHYGNYETFEEVDGGRLMTRAQISNLVTRYLQAEDLTEEIQVNLSDDLLCQGSLARIKGQTALNVRCVNLRENWAEGLLRHEIGTHYFRSSNNRCHPWHKKSVRSSLKMGPVNPTEEGLASLHSVLFRHLPFLWRPALLYYTAYKASKMSFKELFNDLSKYVKNPNVRWDYCLRAKRGQEWTCKPGSFTKDQVYLEGALQLLKRRKILNFQLLVRLGKVAFNDVDRSSISKIAVLGHTRIPWFMENIKLYHKKLDYIAHTNGLTDRVLNLVE